MTKSNPSYIVQHGTVVTLLFYESSSRSYGSFASAVQRLGGGIIPVQNPEMENDHMIVMHPLPRAGEIQEAIDTDARSVYLRNQMRNGLFVRMALLSLVMGK